MQPCRTQSTSGSCWARSSSGPSRASRTRTMTSRRQSGTVAIRGGGLRGGCAVGLLKGTVFAEPQPGVCHWACSGESRTPATVQGLDVLHSDVKEVWRTLQKHVHDLSDGSSKCEPAGCWSKSGLRSPSTHPGGRQPPRGPWWKLCKARSAGDASR